MAASCTVGRNNLDGKKFDINRILAEINYY